MCGEEEDADGKKKRVVSVSTLSRIETGTTSWPQGATRKAIAHALGREPVAIWHPRERA